MPASEPAIAWATRISGIVISAQAEKPENRDRMAGVSMPESQPIAPAPRALASIAAAAPGSVVVATDDDDQEEAFRRAAQENDLVIVATDNMHEILRAGFRMDRAGQEVRKNQRQPGNQPGLDHIFVLHIFVAFPVWFFWPG